MDGHLSRKRDQEMERLGMGHGDLFQKLQDLSPKAVSPPGFSMCDGCSAKVCVLRREGTVCSEAPHSPDSGGPSALQCCPHVRSQWAVCTRPHPEIQTQDRFFYLF
ncbi:hypothetical protein D623_10002991 [Myotis brandtii]|uniref:Uncharacterized protein n=1 Tax=Myotis brandtii TaxID=109478 RepID=S7QAF5_MYOBR|nr:hypothetical protein D623_10002991 [Myotis brandtii]